MVLKMKKILSCFSKDSVQVIEVKPAVKNDIISNGHAQNNNIELENKKQTETTKVQNIEENKLLKFMADDVIGNEQTFIGPFGARRILYCDYVASGKALKSIEDFINGRILPMYANTHTISTITSSTTTKYRDEAKDIIRSSVNASEDDVLIFTGSGTTSAIHKLIRVLNFKKAPVVFCGPFEHHSNLLPWREIAHELVPISEDEHGEFNYEHLEVALKFWSGTNRQIIGSFSAASNVTGVTTDTLRVSALLHKYGGKVFWDYAAGAPYMNIDMHSPKSHLGDVSKDAVFLSTHKFTGSCDAPGLLIASRDLFKNNIPDGGGGGTVLYVSANDHRYLRDIETREEGGTPSIVGSIRAGLAFKLKMDIGCETIMAREKQLYLKAMSVWKHIDNLEILASINDSSDLDRCERLPIFSFLVKHADSDLYLHFNFVSALLNDLFGIQSRGGCACAGVYAQNLLSIDEKFERRFGAILSDAKSKTSRFITHTEKERSDKEMLRPGFTRLNFPYFMKDEDADFLIEAVKMICEDGWRLLPLYHYDPHTGIWKINVEYNKMKRRLKGLASFQFTNNRLSLSDNNPEAPDQQNCLETAQEILTSTEITLDACREITLTSKAEQLRWFLLPHESLYIQKGMQKETKSFPTSPVRVRTTVVPMTKHEMLKNLKKSKKAKALIKISKNKIGVIEENVYTGQADD